MAAVALLLAAQPPPLPPLAVRPRLEAAAAVRAVAVALQTPLYWHSKPKLQVGYY